MRLVYAIIAAFLVVATFAVIFSFYGRSTSTESRALSQVIADARDGRVDKIKTDGDTLTVYLMSGEKYTSGKEHDTNICEILAGSGVKISCPDGSQR